MTKQEAGLRFEDPPEKVTYDWAAIARKLKRKPEQWAVVFERDRTSLVAAISTGKISALTKAKGFEYRTRNNRRETDEQGRERRTCTLYLRYVPANDTTKQKKEKA